VILWRSFERLLGLKIYRVSLGNHYRTACRCLVFYFLARWRGREAYSEEEECFFICLFFYFIACAHVGARADQIPISRSASCKKASKHSHSEVYARESSEKIGGDVFSIVLKNLIWDMILPTSVTFNQIWQYHFSPHWVCGDKVKWCSPDSSHHPGPTSAP
jgi:hypothetical protein